MTDYKSTLNLPKTPFPMKANLAVRESELLQRWETSHVYQQLREQGKKREKFIFHDGPPYANGDIHMGTAVNKILKDIVVKSKTLSGFDAPFIPGWDCHGLPIELNVEKKLGKAEKVGRAVFRKACREYAGKYIEIQKKAFQRLGIIADWEHPYLTMDFSFEANIIRALSKIMQKGYVQQGFKPVHWCLDCASALAEAEVEYAEKNSLALDVRFAVKNNQQCFALFQTNPTAKKIFIPIWTTTPWTLPANQAVALHPMVEYVLVECNDDYLILAEPLHTIALARYQIEHYSIAGKVSGALLEKIMLQHPFYPREVPIVLGDHVTVEAGTGAVHTAPAHGQEDYVIGKKYGLPLENPVNDRGCFTENTLLFAGKHVNQVNELIIDELKKQHALLQMEKITHSYPHCWRHKTPLIFRATPQWFIDMEKNQLRIDTLKAVKEVQWVPEWGENRIAAMVKNNPDWCISRQRTWGVPIAVFVHKETLLPHPNTIAFMEQIAKRVEKEGVDAWFELDDKILLGEDAEHYRKCIDISDVWFDSGVSHDCVLRKKSELHFPADLYLEGSDQHRGWFQSSLLTSMAISGQAPYKIVLTHGYVVDAQGRKMSKSLGNVIAPEKIIQSLGADILRLWVSSIDYRAEMNVSDEILTRTAETYRRLRNTARFLLANLDGFEPEQHLVKSENMLALDRWVVHEACLLQEDIIKAYDAFQFHVIYQKIHHFCSITLGSFYLDVIKDRQYTMPTNSLARRSAQSALFHIIEALVRWLAPILSFTTEEIWHYIPGKRNEFVLLNTWYENLFLLDDQSMMNAAYWEKCRHVRDAVNKEIENQRNQGKMGSALEANIYLYCDAELKKQLDALGDELHFLLITSKAKTILAENETQGVETEIPGLRIQVEAIPHEKCERCWHRSEDVGTTLSHTTLCKRCVENVEGKGEVRLYV